MWSMKTIVSTVWFPALEHLDGITNSPWSIFGQRFTQLLTRNWYRYALNARFVVSVITVTIKFNLSTVVYVQLYIFLICSDLIDTIKLQQKIVHKALDKFGLVELSSGPRFSILTISGTKLPLVDRSSCQNRNLLGNVFGKHAATYQYNATTAFNMGFRLVDLLWWGLPR